MTLDDLVFLAVESYLNIKVWSLEEEQYVFEGDIGELEESDIDLSSDVCSWELGTTESGDAYLGINIE